jgi:hypothetical protein
MKFILVLLFIFHVIFCQRTITYGNIDIIENPENLSIWKERVLWSYAAYCADDVHNWTCYWCKQAKPLTVVKTFFDKKTDTFAFIGHTATSIVIAFRGTRHAGIRAWINNLKVSKKEPFPEIPGAEVHTGFLAAYKSVKTDMMNTIKSLSTKFSNIILTGHSLGGALASILALDLHLNGYRNIEISTFGEPRIGNEVFADYFAKVITKCHRVVKNKDIVVRLPPSLLKFKHVPQEFWFPNSNDDATYKTCSKTDGEDPTCSKSIPVSTSIDDHLTYLGYDKRLGNSKGCG